MKCRQIRDQKHRLAVACFEKKRRVLKTLKHNTLLPPIIRYQAALKLSCLPVNSSITRVKNFCLISHRNHAVYRHFRISRIALRDLGFLIPGLIKSSW